MPHPWPASMLVPAAVLALAAAAGRQRPRRPHEPEPRHARERARRPAARSRRAPSRWRRRSALVALFFPLPRTGGDGTRAAIVPTPAGDGRVNLAVKLDPPSAARDNQWFEVLSWQGRTPGQLRQLTALREVGPGRYVTERPVPVSGNWKTMLRLAKGTHLMALPVYLPPSPQANRAGVPGAPALGADAGRHLHPAARGARRPAWLTTTAYAVLGVVVAVWLGLLAWALGLAEPRRQPRQRATVASTWQPPVAPA